MSDMKCPFCNQELRKISATSFFVCDNCNITGFDKLWQELIRTKELLDIETSEHDLYHNCLVERTEELDRTKKQLEIALDALKDNLSQANFTQMLDASRFHCIRTKCELALDQIQELDKGE